LTGPSEPGMYSESEPPRMSAFWASAPVVLGLMLSAFAFHWSRAVAQMFDDSDPEFALGELVLLLALPSVLAGVGALALRVFRRGPAATASFVLSALSWAGVALLTLGLALWFVSYPDGLVKFLHSFG
jgi:hypothetical protein